MKKEYRNSTRTKKMIRRAFVDLLSERKLIANITVSELAERADIAKSTFYNHYDDLYAVGDEMFNELIHEFDLAIDDMTKNNTSDYKVYVKRVFSFLRENSDIYSKVVDSPDAIFFTERIKYILVQKVLSRIQSSSLPSNKSERYVQISFVANACVDTLVNYFKGDIKMSFDQLENTIMKILDKFF